MLKPTIYLPSRSPCLTEARWRLAAASLEAVVAHRKREAAREVARPATPESEPLVTVSDSGE